MEWLSVDRISAGGGTQVRQATDEQVVQEYTQLLDENAEAFVAAPMIVFNDGESNWLADGFHRLEAYRRSSNCDGKCWCEVRDGSRRDALTFALSANATHGKQRTKADKRRAVEIALADEEWCKWSDRKIARLCAVSNWLVSTARKEVSVSYSQIGQGGDVEVQPQTRFVERNGTVYEMQTANIGHAETEQECEPGQDWEMQECSFGEGWYEQEDEPEAVEPDDDSIREAGFAVLNHENPLAVLDFIVGGLEEFQVIWLRERVNDD